MSKLINKYLFDLVNLKDLILGGFAKKYYSQSGEDIVLSKIFENQKSGFYVDVGAYHPRHYSNTCLLYQKGWRGINIDPNPKSVSFLRQQRKRDINLNLGILSERKEADYYVFNHQSCNTFSEEQKKIIEKEPFIRFLKKEKISCLPLKDVLVEYVPAGTPIDLLNVDVEGLNLRVLESNDWSKFEPQVIVVEEFGLNFDNPRTSPIYNFLVDKSYQLHAATEMSLIFRKK